MRLCGASHINDLAYLARAMGLERGADGAQIGAIAEVARPLGWLLFGIWPCLEAGRVHPPAPYASPA